MKKINTFCPIRDILVHFGNKWSILTLLELDKNEVVRFSVLSRNIPDVSQKMLTTTLRSLENHRLISRTIYPEVPPRVEYSLTEVGKTLIPHINSLVDWALKNRIECLSETDSEPILHDKCSLE